MGSAFNSDKRNLSLYLTVFNALLVIFGSIPVFLFKDEKLIIYLREFYLKYNISANQMIGYVELQNIGLGIAITGFLSIVFFYVFSYFNVQKNKAFILILLFELFTVYYFLNCYICDDAFLSFRTVDNFIKGYGLRWNTIERVQIFTNPLWVFLISFLYFFTDKLMITSDLNTMYFLSMTVSYTVSLAAVYLVIKRHIDFNRYALALIAFFLLFSSKAFVEYTSSGLENPLTYLFIALFYTYYIYDTERYTVRKMIFYFLLVSFSFINRQDTILLYSFPVLDIIYNVYKKSSWKVIYPLALGFSPAIVWLLFSLVYFGFLFPNSYYVKLSMGINSVVIKQGINFLINIFISDVITLLAILSAILIAFINRKYLLYSLSLMLYMIYVVRTGGDFMGGRFLSAPYLISIIILVDLLSGKKYAVNGSVYKNSTNGETNAISKKSRQPKKETVTIMKDWRYTILISLVVYNIIMPVSPIKTPFSSSDIVKNDFGVRLFGLENSLKGVYQNAVYYYSSNPLFYSQGGFMFGNLKFHTVRDCYHCRDLRNEKEIASVQGGGLLGFCKGPNHYLIDPQAITDPLLARLPLPDISKGFVPGHIVKKIPDGLLESYIYNKNMIKDENLRKYYEKIFVITRGKIFSKERFRYIFELNFTGPKRYESEYK